MELYPQCVTCVMNNVLKKGDQVLTDEKLKMKLLKNMMRDFLPLTDHGSCAPMLTEKGYDILRELSGVEDPYREEKIEFNDLMLDMEEDYEKVISASDDPVHRALVLSGIANLIDFGAFESICKEEIIKTISSYTLHTDLPEENLKEFKRLLVEKKSLTILGDNCGEIVLDKILVKELQKAYPGLDITYAVRESPILNDSTLEDAKYVGMDKLVHIISSGAGTPGFIPSLCQNEFLDSYREASVVLAKGVGNFEGAENDDKRVFFLFMIKCSTMAKHLGKKLNTLNFQRGRTNLLDNI